MDFLFSLRCRLGAWLLREHVAALLEDREITAKMAAIKGQSEKRERMQCVSIGLKYAIGKSTQWRRFDDENQIRLRENLRILEHARDAL